MPEIAFSRTRPGHAGNRSGTWGPLAGSDTGSWLEITRFVDRTIQVYGTFDSATCTMQGSNDPRVLTDPASAVAFTLTDPQGNNFARTTAGGEVIAEAPRFVRPVITGGGGSCALTVAINARK